MRLWGKTFSDGQKIRESLVELPITKTIQLKGNDELLLVKLTELAHELDLERPVLLGKHKRDLLEFGRAVFLPPDFMETVDFDRFTIELIPD